jgi:putative SOS response-associated peptidase YedK
MCARMTLSRRELAEIADELDAMFDAPAAARYRPRYNVAPTDAHPLLRLEAPGTRRLELGRWGFVREGRPLLINARAETARVRDAFRAAFARRRCVVPADGFFEWSSADGEGRPFWLHPTDGKLLLFAGLYEEAPGGTERRFTVLTTAPNATIARIHDRMPALLTPDEAALWLAEGPTHLLRPAPDDRLELTPVSRRVSSVKNDDPACILPIDPDAGRQLRLPM